MCFLSVLCVLCSKSTLYMGFSCSKSTLYIGFSISLCVYACLLECIRESVWKLEDLWEFVFSFYRVDSVYQTQINEA